MREDSIDSPDGITACNLPNANGLGNSPSNVELLETVVASEKETCSASGQLPQYPDIDFRSPEQWYTDLAHSQRGAEPFFSYLTPNTASPGLDGRASAKPLQSSSACKAPQSMGPSLAIDQKAINFALSAPADNRSNKVAVTIEVAADKVSLASGCLYPEVQFVSSEQQPWQPVPLINPKAGNSSALRLSSKEHTGGISGSANGRCPSSSSKTEVKSSRVGSTNISMDKSRGEQPSKSQVQSFPGAEPRESELRRTTTLKPFHFEARAQKRPKSISQVINPPNL